MSQFWKGYWVGMAMMFAASLVTDLSGLGAWARDLGAKHRAQTSQQ